MSAKHISWGFPSVSCRPQLEVRFSKERIRLAPSELYRFRNPCPHLRTNIVTNIVTTWILGNAIPVVCCHQANVFERGGYECIVHQACNCCRTLCLLAINMTLVVFCVVCIAWNHFKILPHPTSKKYSVAHVIIEGCRFDLICVIARLLTI